MNDGFERRNKNVALNVEWKDDVITLNVELMTNDGSEHQIEEAALNAK